MKKTMKKILAAALAVTLCVTMLPAKKAQAETTGATSGTSAGPVSVLVNVDELDMTEDQLLEAYMGSWDNCLTISETGIDMEYYSPYTEEVTEIKTSWTYTGCAVISGIPMSDEEYFDMWNGEEPTSEVKALFFESDTHEFMVYKGHDMEWGEKALAVSVQEKGIPVTDLYYFYDKFVGTSTDEDGETVIETVNVKEALLLAQETVVAITVNLVDESGKAMSEWTAKAEDTLTLSIEAFEGFNKDNYSYTWISNSPEVAKVNQKGVLTAVSSGSATIMVALVDNVTGETVSVNPVKVTVESPVVDAPAEDVEEDLPKLIPIPLAWDCSAAISEIEEGINEDGEPYVAIKYEDGTEEWHRIVWDEYREEYRVAYIAFYADGNDQGGDYPFSEMPT